MLTIQSVLSFEAAHRLYDVDTYSKECSDSVHGHSYKVTVVASRGTVNGATMVMDFKLFKLCMHNALDKYDHSCILRSCDPLAKYMQELSTNVHIVEGNPTAEWMAFKFAEEIQAEIDKYDPEVKVESVAVQETENNIATYVASDHKEYEIEGDE